MFIPNNSGSLHRWSGTDKYGEPSFATAVTVKCGVVRLVMSDDRTSVRTDKSASRSSAEETVAQNSKILFPSNVLPVKGDKFVIHGFSLRIVSIEPRVSIAGAVDHYECKLEIWS